MHTDEKIKNLLGASGFDISYLIKLDCENNKIIIPARAIVIKVNEYQKRLMICIMNNINCKREIIRIVWPDKHMYVNDNNYHQLVFQLRRLFQKNGLSRDLISTIPFYGLTINENRLKSLSRFNDDLITSTLSETKINEKKTSFLSNIYAKQKQ